MSDLIKVEEINAISIFTDKGLDIVLDKIKKRTKSIVPDTETVKGRKEIASLSRKVSSSKVLIDEAGKALVSEWKEKVSVVDSERKRAREYLDNLRDEVRQPLTQWEADQEAERIAAEIEADHVKALAMNKVFDREAEFTQRERELAERERLINEREAKAQAERDRLQKEADEKASAERQAIIDAENEVMERKAEAAAKARREDQEKVAKERQEKEAAEQAERVRLQKVADEKAEKNRIMRLKAENKERRRQVEKEVCKALNEVSGIHKDDAMQIIRAIDLGSIPHVSITY